MIGHGQQHLKRGLGDELNRDDRPVGRRQQRAALEQVLQVQVDLTITSCRLRRVCFTSCASRGPAWQPSLAVGAARLGRSSACGSARPTKTRVARVEAELRQRFDASADTLGAIAARLAVAADRHPRRAARSAGRLARCSTTRRRRAARRTGRTHRHHGLRRGRRAARVGRPRLRPAEGALDRTGGAGSSRRARSGRGSSASSRSSSDRSASAARRAAARSSSSSRSADRGQRVGPPDTFVLPTSLVPVTLRAGRRRAHRRRRDRFAFLVVEPAADRLGRSRRVASRPGGRARALAGRRRGRRCSACSAVTLLLCAGPLLELRRGAPDRPRVPGADAHAGHHVRGRAGSPARRRLGASSRRAPSGSPWDLLLVALAALGLSARARPRSNAAGSRSRARGCTRRRARAHASAVRHLCAGAAAAGVLTDLRDGLRRIVSNTTLDLLHFSLHPLEAQRLALAFGLVLLHAAVIWSGCRDDRVPRRRSSARRDRGRPDRGRSSAGLVGAALVIGRSGDRVERADRSAGDARSASPAAARRSSAASNAGSRAGVAGRAAGRVLPRAARAGAGDVSVAAGVRDRRQGAARRRRLRAAGAQPARGSAARVCSRRSTRSTRSRRWPTSSAAPSGDGREPTARSSSGRTPISRRYRLTSAVELYGADGRLVSRFALNLPEYATTRLSTRPAATGTAVRRGLAVRIERAPRAAREPRHLRCAAGMVGSDRRARDARLPHAAVHLVAEPVSRVAAAGPRRRRAEGVPGRDVEFVVYGWSRAPIYRVGHERLDAARRGVPAAGRSRASRSGTTLERDDERVPRLLPERSRRHLRARLSGDHLVRPPRQPRRARRAGAACCTSLLLVGVDARSAPLTSRTPASGRALLREVRSSFYRKLFLRSSPARSCRWSSSRSATRTYFADAAARRRRRGGGADGHRRAAAGRGLRDAAAARRRPRSASIDDQIMVLVSRAIDQDVNLFDRAPPAGDERSAICSPRSCCRTRTPGDVYRRDRARPAADVRRRRSRSATFRYLLAAAPVRAGGREGIVTVPLTLRQQRDRAADRRARSARAVRRPCCSCLLGAGSATGWPSASPIRSTG